MKRLLDERVTLSVRHTNLTLFITSEGFKKISDNQQTLLKIQVDAMKTYLTVLNERIEDLKE